MNESEILKEIKEKTAELNALNGKLLQARMLERKAMIESVRHPDCDAVQFRGELPSFEIRQPKTSMICALHSDGSFLVSTQTSDDDLAREIVRLVAEQE